MDEIPTTSLSHPATKETLLQHVADLSECIKTDATQLPAHVIAFLEKILALFGAVAPVVEALDPAAAPVITEAEAVATAAESVAQAVQGA